MLAYIQRIRRQGLPHLTVELLARAEQLWVRRVQRECFSKEMQTIKSGKPIEKNSRLHRLTSALDAEGILRVQGRIRPTERSQENSTSPIILDG